MQKKNIKCHYCNDLGQTQGLTGSQAPGMTRERSQGLAWEQGQGWALKWPLDLTREWLW